MHVEQVLAAHPQLRGDVGDAVIHAIEACHDCAQTCIACADACLAEDLVHELAECIRLNLDCVDICQPAGGVLTRRSAALRVHSGEVSFPGGGQDRGEDLRDTARREACEEVGLDGDLVEIIGELDHLSTITSNSFIVPFVAVLSQVPVLRASPGRPARWT